jgi:serine/threonine-protein kinase
LAAESEASKLDRFELVAELATGGMATVYLARVSGVGGFQRFVAIKRLHPHLAHEPEFIEMFLDEARLAARIHHPNVVSILEIGATDQGYYIVMEYVEGDTLGRLLSRAAQTGQRVPLKVGLRIVIDMLAGLEAAHELTDDDGNPLKIVHRDVSPQNVLVGVDGSARITDFGVARATSRLSTTRAGQLKGKVAYMAPEQARGDSGVDHRADVFAAGIVLWEVLACRRLFKAEGEAQTLNRVLNEPIPPVSSIWDGVPPALDAIATRALDRDRALRFQSAIELGDALEKAARTLGVHGTSKDVASYLEEALGPEITSQREAVRAWVAKTDPGRKGWSQPPPPLKANDSGSIAAQASGIRVERKVPSQLGAAPSLTGLGSLPPPPRVPNIAVPEPAPTRPEVPPAATSDPAHRSADSTRPMRAQREAEHAVWPWLMLVAAAVAGGLAWVLWTRTLAPAPAVSASQLSRDVPPRASASAMSSAPVAAGGTASEGALPARAAQPAVSSLAVPAPVVAPAATQSGTARAPEPAAPVPARAPGTPVAAPASSKVIAAPDDISRNPYR